MMLYDLYQEKCLQLIDRIKKSKSDKTAYTQACYDLADLKVNYYSQFRNYPECSKLAKFYNSQLGFALWERAEVVDKLHDLGIEIA